MGSKAFLLLYTFNPTTSSLVQRVCAAISVISGTSVVFNKLIHCKQRPTRYFHDPSVTEDSSLYLVMMQINGKSELSISEPNAVHSSQPKSQSMEAQTEVIQPTCEGLRPPFVGTSRRSVLVGGLSSTTLAISIDGATLLINSHACFDLARGTDDGDFSTRASRWEQYRRQI